MQRYTPSYIRNGKQDLAKIEKIYKTNELPFSPILNFLTDEKQNPSFLVYFWFVCDSFHLALKKSSNLSKYKC